MTKIQLTLAVSLLSLSGCRSAAPRPTGCDRDDPTCDPAPVDCGGIASDATCTSYAAAYCRGHVDCCEDAAALAPSIEVCLRTLACSCTSLRSGGAGEVGWGAFDGTAAARVIAAVREAAPSCAVLDGDAAMPHAMFPSRLGAGADCSPPDDAAEFRECASGLYCEPSSLEVDGDFATGACRRYASAGEACATAECAPGTYCAVDGACRAQRGAGEPCDDDDECASYHCAPSGTCAARSPDDTWCGYGLLHPEPE
jgi:hypothetical protein